MGKLKICKSRTRTMVACYTYVQQNLSLELCSLTAKKSYRSAEFPRSTSGRLPPKGRKNSCRWKKYQFLHVPIFVAMRQCELQTRVCLLLPNCKFGRTKGKNVRLQPKGRKNSPEPRVTDAGRHLRSVTVGRNELRHKTPSATSTLKECPNCNS